MPSKALSLKLGIGPSDRAVMSQAIPPRSLFVRRSVISIFDVLFSLKNSTKLSEFLNAMKELYSLVDQDEGLLCVEEYQTHNRIIEELNVWKDREFQMHAYRLLIKLSARSDLIRKSVQSSYPLMKDSIESARISHKMADLDFMQVVLELLSSIMIQGQHKQEIRDHVWLMEFLKSSLTNLKEHPYIVVSCCRLLHFMQKENFLMEHCLLEQVDSICFLLKNYGEYEVVMKELCPLLTSILSSGKPFAAEFSSIMLQHNVHAKMGNSIKHCSQSQPVMMSALLMTLLSFNSEDVIEMILNEDLHTVALNTLERYPETHRTLHLCCLKIFCEIAILLFENDQNHNDEYKAELRWFKIIFLTMAHFMDDYEIMEYCCKALIWLFQFHQYLLNYVGEDVNENQDPVHIFVVIYCLSDTTIPQSLLASACEVIFLMTAYNARLQELLMQKHSYLAVASAMKAFPTNSELQKYGYRALRGLCIFNREHKQTIYKQLMKSNTSMIVLFRECLVNFKLHPSVITEAITTFTCFADIDIVRNQSVLSKSQSEKEDGIHVLIMKLMKRFIRNPRLQESGLECLSVLALADPPNFSVHACKAAVGAMENHGENYTVQKYSLIILQLVSQNLAKIGAKITRKIAYLVRNTMNTFFNYLSILAEACVAIQLLSENNTEFGKAFIQENTHTVVFDLLESYPDQKDLHDIAAECLYILTLEKNMKSIMLLLAIKQGYPKTTQCLLELGADPNEAIENETPLCSAVKLCAANDEMTGIKSAASFTILSTLLNKGANNVHVALELALALRNDDSGNNNMDVLIDKSNENADSEKSVYVDYEGLDALIGLLLKHLGYDKNGNVIWCNMNLKFFSQSWLQTMIFGRQTEDDLLLLQAKRLARKIKRMGFTRDCSRPRTNSLGAQLMLRYDLEDRRKTIAGNSRDFESDLEKSVETSPTTNRRKVQRSSAFRNDSPSFSFRKTLFVAFRSTSTLNSLDYDTVERDLKNFKSIEYSQSTNRRGSLPHITQSTSTSKYSSVGDTILEVDEKSPFLVDAPKENECKYAQVTGEIEEWYKTTLSSANLPFHTRDPRRRGNQFSLRPYEAVLDNRRRGSVLDWHRQGDLQRRRSSAVHETWKSYENYVVILKPKLGKQTSYLNRRPSLISNASANSFTYEESNCDSDVQSSGIPLKNKGFHLRFIDLSSNGMIDISQLACISKPENMELALAFESLTRLTLNNNLLRELPDEVWPKMPNLTHVELNSNKLTSFPHKILTYCRIENLNVSDNDISSFNEETTGFKAGFSLKQLNLARNCITEFPAHLIEYLYVLEEISFQGNKIRHLSNKKLSLKRLKVLNMANNYIQKIPEEFLDDLTSLEVLDFSCNELGTQETKCLPSKQVAARLKCLSTVKLNNNNLAYKEPYFVPIFLLCLKSLRSLNISSNELIGLPNINKWASSNFVEFIAAHNNITELHLTGVYNIPMHPWRNLERLCLAHNNLSALPPEIGALRGLLSLDVSHNKNFHNFPDEMGRLSRLWELPLDGLNLSLDESLVRGRTKDLIGYLHEKLKKSVEHFGVKMMIVGFGGRGKTSLLRALMNKKQQERSVATVGVAVVNWNFKVNHKRKGMETYHINCWDFAGQEEFYSTHQCFLSQRAVYLVIYNLKNGESELKYLEPWLINIKARAPHSPVVIVGTHLDALPKAQQSTVCSEMRNLITTMCQRPGYPQTVSFCEVNATRDNSTVENLRNLLQNALEEFKLKGQYVMGQRIPQSYVKLQELIEEQARNVGQGLPILPQKKVKKMVSDAGLNLDADELAQAVRFLHESGVLLHFEDATFELNQLYFIDPQWLCRMMAQIITVPEINPFINNGILQRDKLPLLFTGKRIEEETRRFYFPPQRIDQYMRLLETFEIALPKNENEFLIPCRLAFEKPDFEFVPDLTQESENEIINREYEMPYLPIGFWSRLVARIFSLVDKLIDTDDNENMKPKFVHPWQRGFYAYWSPGVYFLLEGSRIVNKDIISIQVIRNSTGTRLLAQLVDHVDALVEEWFPGLLEHDYLGDTLLKRTVPCPICLQKNVDEKHSFKMEEIVLQADDVDDYISCPKHTEKLNISHLAPEITFEDFPSELILNEKCLQMEQTQTYLLGQGSFGYVYRALYNHQSCAVKVFLSSGDTPGYKLLRQEAIILSRLRHPTQIRLLAVGRHPHRLVLEYAPKGDLKEVLLKGQLRSRTLQYRVCMQVTDGLAFLHSKNILYRDLKPDNILVFSLSTDRVPINVKLSDYGISRLVTPYGFNLPEGTPGYRAPEVIRGETYDLSADMYSLGIVFYAIATDGKHPYDDIGFRNDIDEAVVQGLPAAPIIAKGSASWPKLQDAIDLCLSQTPNLRPTANKLYAQLSHVEFRCLRQNILISRNFNIDCLAIQTAKSGRLDICSASSNSTDDVQLTWSQLGNYSPTGHSIKQKRVICMIMLNSRLLLGTQDGCILIYDTKEKKIIHQIGYLHDSVLCFAIYKIKDQADFLLTALANGEVAVFDRFPLLRYDNVQPIYVNPANFGITSIGCINSIQTVSGNRVFLSCGSHLLQFRWMEENKFEMISVLNNIKTQSIINCFCVSKKTIYLSLRGDHIVHVYDTQKKIFSKELNLNIIIEKFDQNQVDTNNCRVTAMTMWNNQYLAIGTGGGYLIVVDLLTEREVVVRCHGGAIRSLHHVFRCKQKDISRPSNTYERRINGIRSVRASHGEIQPHENLEEDEEDLYNCLVISGYGVWLNERIEDLDYEYISIWEDNLVDEERLLMEDIQRRQNNFFAANH